jgi:hypothetical protein
MGRINEMSKVIDTEASVLDVERPGYYIKMKVKAANPDLTQE